MPVEEAVSCLRDFSPRLPRGGSEMAWSRVASDCPHAGPDGSWANGFDAWFLTNAAYARIPGDAEEPFENERERRTSDGAEDRFFELMFRVSSLSYQQHVAFPLLAARLRAAIDDGCRTVPVRWTWQGGCSLLRDPMDTTRETGVLAFQQHFEFALRESVRRSVEEWLRLLGSTLELPRFGGKFQECERDEIREPFARFERDLVDALVRISVDGGGSTSRDRVRDLMHRLASTSLRGCDTVANDLFDRSLALDAAADRADEAVALLGSSRPCEVDDESASRWLAQAAADLRRATGESVVDFVAVSDVPTAEVLRATRLYLDAGAEKKRNLRCAAMSSLAGRFGPGGEASPVACNLRDHAGRLRIVADGVRNGRLSPCGLAVCGVSLAGERADQTAETQGDDRDRLPCPSHVGGNSAGWRLVRTGTIPSSKKVRLACVVHDCLAGDVLRAGAISPSFVFEALKYAEREVENESYGQIGLSPTSSVARTVVRRDRRRKRKRCEEAAGGGSRKYGANRAEDEDCASDAASIVSVASTASTTTSIGRTRISFVVDSPELSTLPDRLLLEAIFAKAASVDDFDANGRFQMLFDDFAAAAVASHRPAAPLLSAKVPSALFRAVAKRAAKRVPLFDEVGTQDDDPALYSLRKHGHRGSGRIVRFSRSSREAFLLAIRDDVRDLKTLSLQRAKKEFCRGDREELARVVEAASRSGFRKQ
jgi:hypothetical protein